MKAIIEYWSALSTRERWLVGSAAVLVPLVLGYALIWEPWQQRLAALREVLPRKVELVNWMHAELGTLQGQIHQTRNSVPGDSTPLLTVVEKTGEEAGLRQSIRRMRQGQSGTVDVWLTELPFETWLDWVQVLASRGVLIHDLHIEKSATDTLNIRVSFSRYSV